MFSQEVVDHLNQEMQKRKVSEEMQELRKGVYDKIIIKNAIIYSLQSAMEAMEFSSMDSSSVATKIEELKNEAKRDKEELTKKVEELINNKENKEDFIKILKKTKFIKREVIDHKTFKLTDDKVLNMINEVINEELALLSPYKVAELVASEKNNPALKRFLDLYQPNTVGNEIDIWLNNYAVDESDFQQIRLHFMELENEIMIPTMAEQIATRWAVMIGVKVENEEHLKKVVQEAVEIISKKAVII
ncbi:hypothetical protein [Bacillus toyonensis]|uniref:hypothetical protein n=1 Tax=Bacillus toyonensis TaxID=155322 RepID=UPI002E204C11|nr:hypothetical protein [Bacillus toyonensis]